MRLLLELSMECEPLARSESLCAARALSGLAEQVDSGEGVSVVETPADPCAFAERVALSHTVSEHLGSCHPRDLESFVGGLDLEGPIRVHATRVGTNHSDISLESVNRSLGGILGASLGVDLHSPRTEMRVVFSNRVHLGRRLASVDRSAYERRMAKNLPYNRPISLHPKFARALVNLSLVPAGGRLLDPFCGTGAIVTEASLAGCAALGSDASREMVDGARANMDSLGLGADLVVSDIGDIHDAFGTVAGIATDPPYGRSASTMGEPVPVLMRRAFEAFADSLGQRDRVTIVLHDPEMASMAEGFTLVESHDLWVHRSLTRRFCVLERI